MQHTIYCSCGYTCSSADEEELYSLIRGHIDGPHPEHHQPIMEEEHARLLTHTIHHSDDLPISKMKRARSNEHGTAVTSRERRN